MKKGAFAALLVVIVGVGVVILSAGLYTVTEMQQAIVTQFGEVVDVATKPGLHWKTPFVQKVNFLEKRIMEWDGYPTQVPTRGKKFITVDTWARWRIIDPEIYYTSVTNETGGQAVLDDQIESALRDEISALPLRETVRTSSNRAFEYVTEEIQKVHEGVETIEVGRDGMIERVQQKASDGLEENYGMEIIDVQVKRLNYVQRVRQDVYSRMQSERERIAKRYLSEAREQKQEILGKVSRKLDEIESEGYKEARRIRGEGDAAAARIYAEAYGQAPEFYRFLRTLETYKETLDAQTVLILGTDSAYFRFLEGNFPSGGNGTAIPATGQASDQEAK